MSPEAQEASQIDEQKAATNDALGRARKGDTVALNQICDESRMLAWRYLRAMGSSSAEADDIAQDVYLKVYENIASLKDNFRAWIRTLAQHGRIDYWRRRKRSVQLEDRDFVSHRDGPEAALLREERFKPLERCIKRLAEDEREVIVARFILECSAAETATELGMPLSTVNTYVHRAKQKLADCLGRVRKKGSQGHRGSQQINDADPRNSGK